VKARNKASAHRESIETELKLAFPPEPQVVSPTLSGSQASAGARTPITAASQHLVLRTSIGLVIVRQT
jgi:hypothetical protein